MRKANKPETASTDTTAAASVLLAASGPQAPPSTVSGQPNPMEVLAGVLSRRLLKEETKDQEDVAMAKRARKQGADAMALQRKRELMAQEQCQHMKPWGGSAVTGQRDHQHNYVYLCQFCSKRWTNDELPANLHIDRNLIGGPNN